MTTQFRVATLKWGMALLLMALTSVRSPVSRFPFLPFLLVGATGRPQGHRLFIGMCYHGNDKSKGGNDGPMLDYSSLLSYPTEGLSATE